MLFSEITHIRKHAIFSMRKMLPNNNGKRALPNDIREQVDYEKRKKKSKKLSSKTRKVGARMSSLSNFYISLK